MRARKAIWFFAGLLSCGLLLLGGSAADNTVSALGIPKSTAASEITWSSGGPYGGDAQALALSPEFDVDGLALSGGWRQGQDGPTGGYGIVRTTDAGKT
jgi:hypothetical protein